MHQSGFIRLIQLLVFMVAGACSGEQNAGLNAASGPSPASPCHEQILASGAGSDFLPHLTEQMIRILRQRSRAALRPTDAASINGLAAPMAAVFRTSRLRHEDDEGRPVPVIAGSGFGTVDASLSRTENLLGIYQGNTPSASCNYPFAPRQPLPFDPGHPEDMVPFSASPAMRSTCALLGRCRSMESDIFLNISLPAVTGNQRKFFYDDAVYGEDALVWHTFDEWHPGGDDAGANWVRLGYEAWLEGLPGAMVIYEQANFKQEVLLYYEAFSAEDGGFGGTAYAFVNLYDLARSSGVYTQLIREGICPVPPVKCRRAP